MRFTTALAGRDDITGGQVLLVDTSSVDPFMIETLRCGDRVLVARTGNTASEWCTVGELTPQYVVCVPDPVGRPGVATALEGIQRS